ncbi:MAG: MBL fold metallo-hydrolase [bacterium]
MTDPKSHSLLSLKEANRVAVTIVMDNYSEITLPLSESVSEVVERAPMAIDGKVLPDSLLAENGLSIWVKVFGDEKTSSILLDAGWSQICVPHNLNVLGLDISEIEAIVLSHGHMDHFGSLYRILQSCHCPIIVHPDVFLPRFHSLKSGKKITMPNLKESDLEKMKVKVIKTKKPFSLGNGFIFSSGEILRTIDFQEKTNKLYIERFGKVEPDRVMDDQSLILNVKGKGLLIITGCGHAGVVNIIRYAQHITGVELVYAIIGGFHLMGPCLEQLTEKTIFELKKINPVWVVPMHCNSWYATQKIAQKMPEQFKLSSVGTTFHF